MVSWVGGVSLGELEGEGGGACSLATGDLVVTVIVCALEVMTEGEGVMNGMASM